MLNNGSNVSVLTEASLWIQNTLLGSAGSAIAVIAIAWIGLMMLGGRLPVRRGGAVLLGCFILFSASLIAQGLLTVVPLDSPVSSDSFLSEPPSSITLPPSPSPSDDNADPYFGRVPPKG